MNDNKWPNMKLPNLLFLASTENNKDAVNELLKEIEDNGSHCLNYRYGFVL